MSVMATSDKKVKIAASPINWRNDDFPILGADTSADTILADMRLAGFDGTELGSLFPNSAVEMDRVLSRHNLTLASGWFSAYLLTQNYDQECRRFKEYCQFLRQCGAQHVTTAECSHSPFKLHGDDPYAQHYDAVAKPLFPKAVPTLTDEQLNTVATGLVEFMKIAGDNGLSLGYHPHIQTMVENTDELDQLTNRVESISHGAKLTLTIDTGHLALAGDDPAKTLEKYINQTKHVHVKNIRKRVADAARAGSMGFEFAVVEGVFTVPGDGGIDFTEIFDVLKKHDYHGWLVVEAEQNPHTAQPYLYAKLAREYIREVAGW
jgi:inosose dehydratase